MSTAQGVCTFTIEIVKSNLTWLVEMYGPTNELTRLATFLNRLQSQLHKFKRANVELRDKQTTLLAFRGCDDLQMGARRGPCRVQ